jgi:signal transduction histidine kinase/ActR/RegA family two-component response regulator
LKVKPGPASLLFQPIFPKNDPSTFVGFATTSIHWAEVLTNVVPDYVNGLTCVVSTDAIAYTFEIQNGIPELVGYGDLHDPEYTSFSESVVLNEIETGSSTSAVYTLTVYPTAEMFSEFSTNSPTTVAAGFAGVIAAVACIFFGYDHLMRREAAERDNILEMKRRFVSFISHEIRTPLNTVCMGLELLQSELKAPKGLDAETSSSIGTSSGQVTDEDVGFWLNVTEDTSENAHIAVEILNDLLNYDKLETGTLELETELVFIWDLVEKTVNQFGIQAANRRIEFKLEMERPSGLTIPDIEGAESYDPYNVIGDSIRLSQVIRNLISNALKFAPENSTVQVMATYNPKGLPNAEPMHLGSEEAPRHERAGSFMVCVQDSGVGLSSEQLSRLFNEGVQFDANRLQHGGGSGLGLSIAKGLVEQHSGTISADSPGLGHGSTFMVELPLYEFGEEELKAAIDDKDSTTASEANRVKVSDNVEPAARLTRRVLVAEDSASSRKMLIRLLERSGHSCVPAANGREAVNIMQEDLLASQSNANHVPINSVLMDFEMPLLRGPDATRRIRSLGYDGIIIGITGNVESEDIEYFLKHGADAVMPKPVSLKTIQKFWKQKGKVKKGLWKQKEIGKNGVLNGQ